MDKDTTELVSFLRSRVKAHSDALESFKKNIGADSWALSMERADRAFESATRHEVYSKEAQARHHGRAA